MAKEGKVGRKRLNDAIHGDRAMIRGHTVNKETTWEDWTASKEPGSAFFGSGDGGYGSNNKHDTYRFDSLAPRCYESHPPLKLPGADLVIYGGSCLNPVIKDADVYIGFDGGMTLTKRVWPWTLGDEVRFKVPDMGVPEHVSDFRKLVDWTKAQLEAGRKVHCGCIGGHGRTGMFLAALVSKFGEKDAISYVRKNYCSKAVESSSQVKFLGAQFGINPVEGTKAGKFYSSTAVAPHGSFSGSSSKNRRKSSPAGEKFTPIGGNGCIWG